MRSVGVSAPASDRVFRDRQPRTLREPEIDAALQAQVGEIVCAEHARSGDPAEKRPARVGVGLQRLLRRERHQVLDEGLGEVVLRFAGEMDVRVDQAGKQGRVAEIDHLRVRRHLHAASDGDDPVAFDDHDGAVDQRTRRGIEQARRSEREPRWRRRRTSVAEDLAPLHHEGDVLHRGNVANGVSRDRDHVGELAALQRAGLDPEKLRGAHGGALQRLGRREAPAHQPGELLGIGLAVQPDARVAPEGDADADLLRVPDHLGPGLAGREHLLDDGRRKFLPDVG